MSKFVHTGTPRALLRPAVWSNFLFLIPFTAALYFADIILASVIAAVFVSSAVYHFMSDGVSGTLHNADRAFAGVLTLYNAGLIAFGGFTPPYFYYVLLCIPCALYFFRKQGAASHRSTVRAYELHHSLWHGVSTLITLFSILTFYM